MNPDEVTLDFDPRTLESPLVVHMVHSLLMGVLTGALPLPHELTSFDRIRLMHYAAVLCWVLGHTGPPGGCSGAIFFAEIKALVAVTGDPVTPKAEVM